MEVKAPCSASHGMMITKRKSRCIRNNLQLHGHNRSGLLALDYGLLAMPCNSLQNYELMQSLIIFFSLALAAADDSNRCKY